MDAASSFRWLDQIADDRDLPPVAVRVAIVLRRYFNSRSGVAWPSQARLVDVTGLSRSGLQNALRALVSHGHLLVEVQKGRGSTNQYRPAFFAIKAHEGEHYSPENAHEREPFSPKKAHEGEHYAEEKAHEGGQRVPTRVSRGAHQRGQGVPTSVGTELLERTLRENPRNELNTARLPADSKRRSSSKSISSDEVEDAFDRFWQNYPRRVSKGAARSAFAAALKKTDAENLIDGARRYASATLDTEPRFIKHAASWLRAEAWLDEPDAAPAQATTLDAEGNVIQTTPAGGGAGRRRTDAEIVNSWSVEDLLPGGKYSCPF
ncbi:helix-turn-helix domain-containing protein [Roseinatronobacter alkalisoli]|uniref:Helix-turn-helix domain-containing protein n=1 Tax=Roseinatronobacter alkalisoli TaxID=3028235 RepID=A0ABT5TDJ6_9RHOB|nr:helix-turn-helix domain-containing protein [Roseinatronobacter sp. HJB301]MDD7973200.1 helix-turn-helix domain-containing protein [Roseinatronobacter sp. HJB301]